MTDDRVRDLTPSGGLGLRDPAADEVHRLRELVVRAPRTGLYVHLPFCTALCPYCDFAVVVGRDADHARYVEAVTEEAKARRTDAPWDALHTVFIGGGTPSLIDADAIARLLEQTRNIFGWRPDVEVSIEANPETVTLSGMRTLAAAGVNRVSLGAQSFDAKVLDLLGRTHDADATERAVDAVRAAGISRLNLDLIYGTPGETRRSWQTTLRRALALHPDHLSTYALTIEERTAFGRWVEIGEMAAPDDDLLADDFGDAIAFARDEGLFQYELSNFARPGAECRHNLGIWCGGDYLGLGLGAHSLRAGRRWNNRRMLSPYLADPAGQIAEDEVQDARARAEEWLGVRIRLRAGFPEAVADALLPGLSERADPLVDAGLLERIDGYLRTTFAGMLLENDVTLRLAG